jgi:fatty-acid desaturase
MRQLIVQEQQQHHILQLYQLLEICIELTIHNLSIFDYRQLFFLLFGPFFIQAHRSLKKQLRQP